MADPLIPLSKRQLARLIIDHAPNMAPQSRMTYDELALFVLLEHNRDCSEAERVHLYGSAHIGLKLADVNVILGRNGGDIALLVQRAVEGGWAQRIQHPDNGSWRLVRLSGRGHELSDRTPLTRKDPIT